MVVADYRAAVAEREAAETTLEAFEQELQQHATTPLDLATVESYLEETAQLKVQLLTCHRIIHINAPSGTDMDPHNQSHNNLLKRAIRTHAAFKGIKLSFPVQPPPATSTMSTTVPHVRLPALELPSFSGNLQEWVAFRDIFEAAVGSNTTLQKSQKLTYLKSCVVGEAAKHIRSLVLSDANYDIAWKALTDRYQNERELLFTILKRLLNQSNASSSSSSVRALIDTTKECTRSLEILKIPVEHWSAILLFILFQKLDTQSKELWEQQLKDSTIPNIDQMYTFLEQRARALAASSTSAPRNPNPRNNTQRQPPQNFHAEPSATCKLECGGSAHPMFTCTKFRQMNIVDRISQVKKFNLCFNCFNDGHSVTNCGNKKSCKICNQRHHTMIHQEARQQVQENKRHQPSGSSNNVTNHHIQNTDVDSGMLATALISIIDDNGQRHLCRALLDSGSPVSFISEGFITRIGLRSRHKQITVTGLQDSTVGTTKGVTTFAITSHFTSDFNMTISALIMAKVSSSQPKFSENIKEWNHIRNLKLADPKFNTPAPVDILLGASVFWTILEQGKICGPPGTPFAVNSALGYLIGGTAPSSIDEVNSFVTNIELDNSIQRFWEAESLPEQCNFTEEERKCEEHFQKTHTRTAGGRFMVSLPFNQPVNTLGTSRSQALIRFHQLERRFTHHKNPLINEKRKQQRKEYNQFMKEYEQMGHMTRITDTNDGNLPNSIYYIPHHFIEKPSSTTTKFRVVFDASAKTSSGKSLNDIMMVGPVVQNTLFSIITRFRKHPVAFTADIEKMYRQILINPSHRPLQRILWRYDTSSPVMEFELNTVTYGTASAPYLATRCLKQLADSGSLEYPLAASVVATDAYVDDIQSGTTTINLAIQTIQQLNKLCASAGFPLRKWTSNREEVLSSIPIELRETKSLIPLDTDHTIKALGIYWDPKEDVYLFKLNLPTQSPVCTKRIILAQISKIFDPLGWLSPLIITAKIFMQELWKEQLGWDAILPLPLQDKWTRFRSQLHIIEQIKIPRCVMKNNPNRVVLCCYSDASILAFASSIYTCCYYDNHPPQTALVAAKSRVAQLNSPSLPRLELCGAVLLSSLAKNIIISMNIKFDNIRCYTDSTITLAWINSSPQRWKTYVRRRVQMIHDNLPDATWYHVPGIQNPSDCASRGISPSELVSHPLWWNGTEDMKIVSPPIPHIPGDIFSTVQREEKTAKQEIPCLHSSTETDSILLRYSSFRRLVRVTAWIRRYITNRVLTRRQEARQLGALNIKEISLAQDCIIRMLQHQSFPADIKLLQEKKELRTTSKILSLSPFLDSNGILRVGGRLRNAPWSTNRKHPILLPKSHHITKCIIMDYHLQHFHGGPQITHSLLSQKYWIVGGKSIIQYMIKKCTTCIRHKANTMKQFMGHLPAARITPSPVFSKCGLDYAGPFIIKPFTRSRIELKAYMAIFICFATKAIHLEVVKSLSTPDFIAALRRFISRRGIPSDIYSDCGTNFVGASMVLTKLFTPFATKSHNTQVANECSSLGIQWHFNPASAPHFGGLWEAGVRSVKHHLRRVVGSSRLTYDELETLLVQIEAILNSRPITPVSTDPNDLEVLTPAHFLLGRPLTQLPDADLSEVNPNRLDRWQIIQQQQQTFWNRWSKEHITRLQQRPKWMNVSPQIEIGNMVIIKEDRLPPLKWKLGRVTQLFPGQDGLTRVVTLKTADGELKRPIHKLCLLPVDNDNDN